MDLRSSSPLVQRGRHWRTSVLQTQQKLRDAIESRVSPNMDLRLKEILFNTADWCDNWSEALTTRDDVKYLAGLPTPSGFNPSRPQKIVQAHFLMRLSLLDHLVWHLLPNKFPLPVNTGQLTVRPETEDHRALFRRLARQWQERLSRVIKALVPVAQSEWPEMNNDLIVSDFRNMHEVLYARVVSLENASIGSKALANLHSLALGVLLYAVRLS
jgi:hypothetical protein